MDFAFEDNSSDNDVFVLKQIKPVIKKLTLKEAESIKKDVLSSFNSEKQLEIKKKGKIKNRILHSKVNIIKQKKKSKVENTINKYFITNTSKSERKLESPEKISHQNVKEKDLEIIEEINKSNSVSKKSNSIFKDLDCKTSDIPKNIQLSPGISRKRKRFIINESDKPVISKSKVKTSLIGLFNEISETTPDKKESKTINEKVNKNTMQSVLDNNLCESVNEDKLEKFLDPAKNYECTEKESEINVMFNESQDFLYFNEEDEEKYLNNSEILCFLLKKIIKDETNKQINLVNKSLQNGNTVEKLFSQFECDVINKFFNLNGNACKLFVRMLHRKKSWHRVSNINYSDIGNNLENEFKILNNENFVDVDMKCESLTTLMDLLSKPEILKLCKASNLNLKYTTSSKKEDLIKALIKDSHNQKSVMDMFKRKNSVSRAELLKTDVINLLGMCVKINEKIYEVFYKILLLFSFDHYYNEESKRLSQELLMCLRVYKNMVKYPTYKLSQTVIFETCFDFDEYKKAVLLQDCFDIAVMNKEHDKFISAFHVAKNEFQRLLKNEEYLKRFSKLPSFLKKFSAGTVYAKILTNYCKLFKKKADNCDIAEIAQLLIDQNLFLVRKKGEWCEILSKALESQKLNDAATEVIIKYLEDPNINEVQKLTLQLRGQSILKKKSHGIKDCNLKAALQELCVCSMPEPQSIEIKGKVLDGNNSGFKSVYVQESKHGKLYLSVEEKAISYYKDNGFTKGYHSEGLILQSIYFLLFYDIIYGLSPEGVFQSPYQEAPLDFYSSSFYYNRKQEIDLLLSDMLNWDDEQIELKIKDTYYKNYNTTCIINWTDQLRPEIFIEIIQCITMPVMVLIFQRFIQNFRVTRSGFPDLTLWNPEKKKCKFVEVKSPNDKLSPAQKLWLDYLKNIGVDCEVCHVKNTS